MTALPFTAEDDGVLLTVRVTPRARASELAGLLADVEGRPMLAIRLNAPPVEGAANKALIDFLARALSVPRSSVRVASGETSRVKRVAVAGLTPRRMTEWLEGEGLTLAP